MSTPLWLEEIDHTGDAGLRVHAPDVAALFARAAWGMFAVLADPETIRPTQTRELEVHGSDQEDLLLRWLSELNYLHLVEGVLFCRFEIREWSERKLVARVSGEGIDPARHSIHTEIKAVTYHGLEIREVNGEWRAQIIFDM